MTDQPTSERFKAEVPEVSGTASTRAAAPNPAIKLVVGLLAVLLVVFLGARWALRPRKVEPSTTAQQPQIEVPPPAPDPNSLLPHASDADAGIADTTEMGKPWTSKEFFIRNKLTGEDVPGLLIRLPIGSASQETGYWAFEVQSSYGNCKLEYITDLNKLKADYGFEARHPMVGNPCSRTVYDPVKTSNLPGSGVWARGAIVQGSDLRPPLGIELRMEGKKILAVRME